MLGALVVLSSPGLLLAALVPWRADLVLMVVVALVLSGLTWLNRRGRPGTEIKSAFSAMAFLLGQYVKIHRRRGDLRRRCIGAGPRHPHCGGLWRSCTLLGISPWLGPAEAFRQAVHVIILGFLSLLLVTLPLLLFLLRRNENLDAFQDAPPVNERMLCARCCAARIG